MALIMLRNVPSRHTLVRAFNHKMMLDFGKCFICTYWEDHVIFEFRFVNVMYDVDWFTSSFLASIEMIMWFFTFLLLMCCMMWIDLHMLGQPCASGMNPTWSWCMVFFMCCWMLLAKILSRIFASMFIKDILWHHHNPDAKTGQIYHKSRKF